MENTMVDWNDQKKQSCNAKNHTQQDIMETK